MFADLPLDPTARAERQRRLERDRLVQLRDRLQPPVDDNTTADTVCNCSGATCLVAYGTLAILAFILLANDAELLLAILVPTAANVTLVDFNFTFVNGTNSSG